ncbi:MAG: hypothetical protein SWZ49_00990, partial [Cyanobacteriota bacterium]|nr:hypothetical protein [Cyanobacteriota bacterium]
AYIYNAAVANRKTQYQKLGHSVDYFEQQASLPGFKETWIEINFVYQNSKSKYFNLRASNSG